MSAPRISILLPVRNGARFLKSALRSLERQTLEDFEIIAVNDGSSDQTGTLLEEWRARDPRLRILHLDAIGLVGALNAGLRICRGDLIARLDADDAMLPRRLEIQARLLAEKARLDIVSCRVRCFPSSSLGQGFKIYEAWLNGLITPADHLRERFIESPLAHPTAVIRRQILLELGGYREMGWAEDYDLWLRLLERGHQIEKVNQVLYLWRDHAERQTRVDSRYSKKSFLACKAHFLVRGPLRGAKKILIWGAGPTGRGLAKAIRAQGLKVDAFLDIDKKKFARRPGGSPVYDMADLPRLWCADARLLIAVSRRGARELIRAHLESSGLIEGVDAFFAA